jgi:hypothetical protein
MAIDRLTVLQTFFEGLRDGVGGINDTMLFQRIVDMLHSIGTVGGGLVSRRAITAADPAGIAMTTVAATVVGTGCWNSSTEARGVVASTSLGRVTIDANAGGSYFVFWKMAFRSSVAPKTFGFALAASKLGAAPVIEQDTIDEVTATATATTFHASGGGFIAGLSTADYVELQASVNATTANLIPRQGLILLLRVA